MEMDVQVESRAEALDQGDCAGVGCRMGVTSLFDQMRGYAAVDDTEHPPRDRRAAGEQETQESASSMVE